MHWSDDNSSLLTGALSEPVPAITPSGAKSGKKFGINNSTEFQSPTSNTSVTLEFFSRKVSQCRPSMRVGGKPLQPMVADNSDSQCTPNNILSGHTFANVQQVRSPIARDSDNIATNLKNPSMDEFLPTTSTPVNTPAPITAGATPATNPPASWLSARLILGGMSQPLALDCEQKLVHTEGFSSVRDLAECPASMFHHTYLTSVGIVGLGTQQQVLRLHSELHAQYTQHQQQAQQQQQQQPIQSPMDPRVAKNGGEPVVEPTNGVSFLQTLGNSASSGNSNSHHVDTNTLRRATLTGCRNTTSATGLNSKYHDSNLATTTSTTSNTVTTTTDASASNKRARKENDTIKHIYVPVSQNKML